eukprot:539865_1
MKPVQEDTINCKQWNWNFCKNVIMTKKKQFQMGTTHTVESVVCDENIYTVRQPHPFRDVYKVLQNKYDLERKAKKLFEDIVWYCESDSESESDEYSASEHDDTKMDIENQCEVETDTVRHNKRKIMDTNIVEDNERVLKRQKIISE